MLWGGGAVNNFYAPLDSEKLAESFTFHIIHNGISQTSHDKLKELESNLSKTFPIKIILHQTSKDAFENLTPWGEQNNYAAYFRLLIPKFAPKISNTANQKCLYLDIDMYIDSDIRALFRVDLGDSVAAVVRDISVVSEEYLTRFKMDEIFSDYYFNSGFLLLNTQKFSKLDLASIDNFTRNGCAEQDFLNFIFDKKVLYLALEWNLQWYEGYDAQTYHHPLSFSEKAVNAAWQNAKIIHFLQHKPWKKYAYWLSLFNGTRFVVHPYIEKWLESASHTDFYLSILAARKQDARKNFMRFFKARLQALKVSLELKYGLKFSISQRKLTKMIFFRRYMERNSRMHSESKMICNARKNNILDISKKYIELNSVISSNTLIRKIKINYRRLQLIPVAWRRFLNKVDVPYIELVLTTKCTLNCQSCNNLMQYFESKNQYMGNLDSVIASVRKLLERVDSVQKVRLIGGEPLLFKDLPKLVEFLDSQSKIKCFDIVTNATIKFSPDLLNALSRSKKSAVAISDYSKSPNLEVKTHIDSVISDLNAHKIPYSVLWQDDNVWFEPGKIYKRRRSKEKISQNFKDCLMPCVSLTDGKLFICPIASSLSKLKDVREFEGDFVDLDSENVGNAGDAVENLGDIQNLAAKREQILKFYRQDFFKACDYCHDMGGGGA